MISFLINIIPAIVIAFHLQLFLHEVGHWIGGVVTGWKFIFMQIYKVILTRNHHNKLVIHLSETNNFQCIMYPKNIYNNAFVYTLGGCIMNAVMAAVGLVLLVVYHENPIIWLYSWCFFMFGIGLFLMNGIPRTNRFCNDMACYQLLHKDPLTQLCHNAQLLTAKYLHEGKTYRLIGENLICLTHDTIDNDILAYQAVLEYYYYLERFDLRMMRSTLQKVNMDSQISSEIRNIIHLEQIYQDLLERMNGITSAPISENEFKSNIESSFKIYGTAGDVHFMRIEGTYQAYVELLNGNDIKCNEIIQATIQAIYHTKHQYQGEVNFCIDQLNRILYMKMVA